MAKIMEMNYGHPGFPERGQPDPAAEVPSRQRCAVRAGEMRPSASVCAKHDKCHRATRPISSGKLTGRRPVALKIGHATHQRGRRYRRVGTTTEPAGRRARNWHNVAVPADAPYVEVNGHEPTDDAIALLDHDGWGHFTAMQVRDGATRGLDLHIARLAAAHRDIYGSPLDGDVVRAHIRHALNSRSDASVRVYGYWAGVILTIRDPQDMPDRAHTMTAQQFQRPLARLKHVGSWAQGRFHDLATAAGFDEGLLVDETGRISEGTITNVAFWRDGSVVWPAAPKLDGITMLVLQRQLRLSGVPQIEEVVRVQDLASYQGMILCNARGWAPVSRVDDRSIPTSGAFTDAISTAYDQCPLDRI
jgi:branched-subunit amino acid aminotransferase/4-amino-4-deoxychorismate lyase